MCWDPSLCNLSARPGGPTQESPVREPPLIQGQAWPLTSMPAPQSRPQELDCCQDTIVLGPFSGRALSATCSSFCPSHCPPSSWEVAPGAPGQMPQCPLPAASCSGVPAQAATVALQGRAPARQDPDRLPASQFTVPCGPPLAQAVGHQKGSPPAPLQCRHPSGSEDSTELTLRRLRCVRRSASHSPALEGA